MATSSTFPSSDDEFYDAEASNASQASLSSASLVICGHCGEGPFKGQRGLSIHVSRMHRDLQRQALIPPPPAPPSVTPDPPPVGPSVIPPPTDFMTPIPSSTPAPEVTNLFTELQSIESLLIPMREAEVVDESEFSKVVVSLQELLKRAIDVLPGPKHPSTKYYAARRQGRRFNTRAGAADVSNPTSSRKKKSAAVRATYDWNLAQYNYANCRRKVWRQVTETAAGGRKTHCTVPVIAATSHFEGVFTPNACVRHVYESVASNPGT